MAKGGLIRVAVPRSKQGCVRRPDCGTFAFVPPFVVCWPLRAHCLFRGALRKRCGRRMACGTFFTSSSRPEATDRRCQLRQSDIGSTRVRLCFLAVLVYNPRAAHTSALYSNLSPSSPSLLARRAALAFHSLLTNPSIAGTLR
jgi:hypothetical protein